MSKVLMVAGALFVVIFLAMVFAAPVPTRESIAASRFAPVAPSPLPVVKRAAPAPAVMQELPRGVETMASIPLPALDVVRAGAPLLLAGPRARPMLLHLWASWCGPCRAELPSLLAYGARGPAEVVAVSVDDHFEDVQKFFNGRIPPQVAWDQKIALEAALDVNSLPTTFLVDSRGKLRARFSGMQDWDSAEVQRVVSSNLSP